MTVNAIVATTWDYGIGRLGTMPWPRNKADMKWFREKTMGGIVIMGRKTWESLPEKHRPLDGRMNIVLTSREIKQPRPHMIHNGSVGLLLERLTNSIFSDRPIWIIGGGEIYRQALPQCCFLYQTIIPGDHYCDTFIDEHQIDEFKYLKESHEAEDGTRFEIRSRL